MGLFGKKDREKAGQFIFLTEQIFSMGQIGIAAVGTVSGKVHVGDAVYLYHPGVPLAAARVDKLELAPGRGAEEAENCMVSLHFENMRRENIQKFAVLSNIRPDQMAEQKETVENPQLRGLLSGYAKFEKEPEFLRLFHYSIAHAKFMMAVFADGTNLSFPTVANTDGTSAIPVFTDPEALLRWQNVFDEKHPKKTAVQTFGEAAALSQNGNDGIVINPFDDAPYFLSNDLITKISR